MKRSLANCQIKCPADQGAFKRIFGITLGGVLVGAVGGILFWKWSQINTSGVPLGFAVKRALSRKFLEGHLDLTRAYQETQR